MPTLIPSRPVPPLEAPIAGGGRFRLADETPEHFLLMVVYRGLHCPVCRRYLGELEKLAAKFAEKGVSVFVVSSDSEERAVRAKTEWGLANLRIGYGLSVETARAWGLFISNGRGSTSAGLEEPAQFAEPGVFLIRPDGTLYWSSVSTMPFARPHFDEILQGVEVVLAKNYPPRGDA